MHKVISDDLHGDYDWFWIQHDLDVDPPEWISITSSTGYAQTWINLVNGDVFERLGVSRVDLEVRSLPGGSLTLLQCPDDQPRDGTWSCVWDAGNASGVTGYELRARAYDLAGNVGDWSATVSLPVDQTAPQVILDAAVETALNDGFVGPTDMLLSGQLLDDQQAKSVAICLDQEYDLGCTHLAVEPAGQSSATWHYDLSTDVSGDGVEQVLNLYGLDGAGNRSDVLSYEYLLDTVGPSLETTQLLNEVLMVDYLPPASGEIVLQGTVSDGIKVSSVSVRIIPPNGDVYWIQAMVNGENWSFRPVLTTTGQHTLFVEAYDSLGNVSFDGPYELSVGFTALKKFVLLSEQGLWLKSGCQVMSGDLGTNQASEGPFVNEDEVEVSIAEDVKVLDPLSRLMGDSIKIHSGAEVYDVFYNELDNRGTIYGGEYTLLGLPLVDETLGIPEFTIGEESILVSDGSSVTIQPGSYWDLQSGKKATIRFTGGVYNFNSWLIGNNVKLYFQAPTEIRIKDRLWISWDSYLGPAPSATDLDAKDIFLYINGSDGDNMPWSDAPKAARFAKGVVIHANIATPNGTLLVEKESQLTGAFLGRFIILEKGVQVFHASAYQK